MERKSRVQGPQVWDGQVVTVTTLREVGSVKLSVNGEVGMMEVIFGLIGADEPGADGVLPRVYEFDLPDAHKIRVTVEEAV